MSEGKERQQRLVFEAAGVVSASNKKIGITTAMGLVGFTKDEIKNMTLYQQVRRRAEKLTVVDASSNKSISPPTSVGGNSNKLPAQLSDGIR